ncbi:STAS domain-containing protein [Pontibacter ruber]|uniref:Anti-sigma factor antagonist n=1 Tax=Pontibacter ruber TaxID=1343895 RepID=A0ABW5CZU6_9BACT|nr:STAS domain-containing protein [Pontibacter ruber]
MKAFAVSTTHHEEGIVLQFEGELDASSCILADQALEEAIALTTKSLLLDCTRLHYISSAGLGVLLAAFQACSLKSMDFILFGMTPKIKNVFEILGLERIIKTAGSLEEAKQLVS